MKKQSLFISAVRISLSMASNSGTQSSLSCDPSNYKLMGNGNAADASIDITSSHTTMTETSLGSARP